VGGYMALIPIMIGSVISYIITGRYTIYEKQIAQKSFSMDVSCLSMVKVSEAMNDRVITIPFNVSIDEAYRIAMDNPHYLYPVVDDNGRILGVAPRERIDEVHQRLPDSSVMQVLQTHFEPVDSDKEVLTAFEIMNDKQISRMIVVDPEDQRRVVGTITRYDILNIMEHLDERHHEY
jgi:CIC family chloride channel protein